MFSAERGKIRLSMPSSDGYPQSFRDAINFPGSHLIDFWILVLNKNITCIPKINVCKLLRSFILSCQVLRG